GSVSSFPLGADRPALARPGRTPSFPLHRAVSERSLEALLHGSGLRPADARSRSGRGKVGEAGAFLLGIKAGELTLLPQPHRTGAVYPRIHCDSRALSAPNGQG